MPYIPPAVAETSQSLRLARHLGPPRRGKVRDIYDLGEKILIVTTDRISSDDHVLSSHIENKGTVLSGISVWWFQFGLLGFSNHLEAWGTGIDEYLPHPEIRRDPDLQSRSIVAQKCVPEPVEFVVRGYITGSGWRDYQKTGAICGIELPEGLREGDKLPEPIFTPATKAESGHDQNVSEAEAGKLVTSGPENLQTLKHVALMAYEAGRVVAENHDIILADTKFEMDRYGRLIDEVLTPDSSRFWLRRVWEEKQRQGGGTPPSLDKQPLRDYLKQFRFAEMSDEDAGRVALSPEVREAVSERYVELLARLTGMSLPTFKRNVLALKA